MSGMIHQFISEMAILWPATVKFYVAVVIVALAQCAIAVVIELVKTKGGK